MVLFLLVLAICFVAYMRAIQPATWNSWMVLAGTPTLAVPVGPGNTGGAGDLTASPKPSPPPVGGMIRNGDFTNGGAYWQGDGRFNPSLSKGLIVTLNPRSWTRIYQTFPSDKGTQYSIEVTYRVSPNLTLSKDSADYAEISKQIDIPGFERFGSISVQPGEFYGTIGDPTSTTMAMEVFSPQLGSSEIQDYQHAYPSIPAFGDKTFALAFPPGSGMVAIVTVYVKSN
jgi:hypothetical protein